jgi:hypothetical protein
MSCNIVAQIVSKKQREKLVRGHMWFGQATWIVDDFAINLQLCNEGIDSHKVDIPGVLLQMQKLRSCLGRETELTACLRRLTL